MDKVQLKPCPHCGGSDVSFNSPEGPNDNVYDFVICGDCGATCNEVDTLPESDCVSVWNSRVPPQPPSASGEREAFEAWLLSEHGLTSEWQAERNCFKDFAAHLAWKAWQARAALAPSPGIDAAEQKPVGVTFLCPSKNMDKTQCNFMRADVPEGTKLYAAPPAAQPSAEQQPVAWLQQNINRPVWFELAAANEKALTKDWTDAFPVFRQTVASSAEPHPPNRACMCDACKPSFENGADDPAQRYDIARQVPGPSAEWMAEAERLVEAYANEFAQVGATYARDIRRAALRAHLTARP